MRHSPQAWFWCQSQCCAQLWAAQSWAGWCGGTQVAEQEKQGMGREAVLVHPLLVGMGTWLWVREPPSNKMALCPLSTAMRNTLATWRYYSTTIHQLMYKQQKETRKSYLASHVEAHTINRPLKCITVVSSSLKVIFFRIFFQQTSKNIK